MIGRRRCNLSKILGNQDLYDLPGNVCSSTDFIFLSFELLNGQLIFWCYHFISIIGLWKRHDMTRQTAPLEYSLQNAPHILIKIPSLKPLWNYEFKPETVTVTYLLSTHKLESSLTVNRPAENDQILKLLVCEYWNIKNQWRGSRRYYYIDL